MKVLILRTHTNEPPDPKNTFFVYRNLNAFPSPVEYSVEKGTLAIKCRGLDQKLAAHTLERMYRNNPQEEHRVEARGDHLRVF